MKVNYDNLKSSHPPRVHIYRVVQKNGYPVLFLR